MKIKINRQSVCMADDCFDHEKTYTMKRECTCKELFEQLKKDDYLPNISGDNVVWVLTIEAIEYVFSYFTLIEKLNSKIENEKLIIICKNAKSIKLFFKYYSSPKHWKDVINQKWLNNHRGIACDYWKEETRYCDYIISLSQQQMNNLQEIKKINKREYTILSKGGSMCFYGEWFGRPYDNFHQIIKVFYENDWLEIYFLAGESLLIQKPEGILNTETCFKVNEAITVIWKCSGCRDNEETIYMYKKVADHKYVRIVNGHETKFVPMEGMAIQCL